MISLRSFTSWPIRRKLMLLLVVVFLPAFGAIAANGINDRRKRDRKGPEQRPSRGAKSFSPARKNRRYLKNRAHHAGTIARGTQEGRPGVQTDSSGRSSVNIHSTRA